LGRRIKKHGNSFANTNVEGGEPDKDNVVCKNISASDCKKDMSNVSREVQNI